MKDNISIAQFMGYVEEDYTDTLETNFKIWIPNGDIDNYKVEEEFTYDSDWNELMLVVKKIEEEAMVFIDGGWEREVLIIAATNISFRNEYTEALLTIDPVYKTVIEYINWYKEIK